MHITSKNKLAFLFLIPVFIFYTGYFFNYSPGYKPTGFIQYDNISYVAYAKQYLDHPGGGIGYSNPLNDSGDHPRIYFQTQTAMIAVLLRTGIDPGLAICLFSLLFCFLAVRTAISLFDELYPGTGHRKKIMLLFIWGGGIISLICFLLRPFMSTPLDFWSSISYFDPEDGWWGLNFGRSLIFGTESYYHFLFFSAILLLVRKKWLAASLVAFVLTFSHPFTGIHLLLVTATWLGIEKIVFSNKDVPYRMLGAVAVLIGIHLYYYLGYLPSFADHKSVSDQYSVNWNYWHYRSLPAFIPAYILVFGLFLFSFRMRPFKDFIQKSNNRLLLCLAFVSVVLCNHDLFIKPMQPIHFSRGYEWTAYFLMGVPALQYLFSLMHSGVLKRLAVSVFVVMLLSDNLLWITKYVSTTRNNETTVSDDQAMLLNILNANSSNNTLLIGSDPFLMPYCAVYTKGYPWMSHPYTTPFYRKKKESYKKFILTGEIDTAWRSRNCILVFNKTDSMEKLRAENLDFNGKVLLDSEKYKLVEGHFSRE